MCGIAGIIGKARVDEQAVMRMIRPLAHRGPDDEGIWFDPEARVGLGHRRLAIIDLSPQGHQPMHSSDGRFVLTFNGEIYNHPELRAELEDRGMAPDGGSAWSATASAKSRFITAGPEGISFLAPSSRRSANTLSFMRRSTGVRSA